TLGSTTGSLPRVLRFGAVMPLTYIEGIGVLATAEISRRDDDGTLPAGGAELSWVASNGVKLEGRVGGMARAGGSDSARVVYGGGLTMKRFALDYAYESLPAL